MKTAILLIIFRRAEATRQLIDRLREVKPARIYVAADGPRPNVPGESERCEACQAVIEEIDWPCEIQRRFSPVNQGCRWGPANAITWFFEHEPEGIILEDDIMPEASFFPFCETLLERYRTSNLVGCICGYNFLPSPAGGPSYFFSKISLTWGWATWRHQWKRFAEVSADFEKNISALNLSDWFSPHDDRDMKRKLREAYQEDHVWDFLWMLTLWSNDLLTVLPGQSLTRNVGIGGEATHTLVETSFMLADSNPMLFPLRHPAEVAASRSIDRAIFHDLLHTPTFGERVAGVLKSDRPLTRLREILMLRLRRS